MPESSVPKRSGKSKLSFRVQQVWSHGLAVAASLNPCVTQLCKEGKVSMNAESPRKSNNPRPLAKEVRGRALQQLVSVSGEGANSRISHV